MALAQPSGGYDPRSLPPGPRAPLPWLTLQFVTRPEAWLTECARRHGDIFTVPYLTGGHLVVVHAPEHVRQVVTADASVLSAGAANVLVAPIVGRRSLFVLEGREHHRQRRLLAPPLRAERMARYADIIVQSTASAVDAWPRGAPLSLHRAMLAITRDVILRAIFGVERAARLDRFARLLAEFLDAPPGFLSLVAYRIDLPFAPYRWYRRARREVDREIYGLIAERRRASDVAARDDVLSLLVTARDERGQPMTDEEVHDELMTLITAGHETTAAALAWAFERLLRTPDALAAATTEARSWARDTAMDPAALGRLSYIDAVAKEVLRFRPAVPFILRRVVAPFSIAGYTLPPGVTVAPCVHVAHRRAASYPEPDRFWPERWLGAKVDPYRWFPFGGGARRCVGMGFALYEMKAILATVLASVRLRAASPAPERTRWSAVVLAPARGAQAVVER